jgi:hypothetical protein
MIRLSDGLARRRMVYPAPLPTVPRVMVIDVDEPYRSQSLPLGRYYPIVVETDGEMEELERFLAAERSATVVPDVLDMRSSQIVSDEVLACRFAPPAAGWPWLTLFRWPSDFQQATEREGVSMARGCYTFELSKRDIDDQLSTVAVLDQLARRHHAKIRMISGDAPAGHGQA